jgi:hypothetical protein
MAMIGWYDVSFKKTTALVLGMSESPTKSPKSSFESATKVRLPQILRFQKASKFHKKSIPSTERPLNSLGHESTLTWRGWRGLRAAQNRIRC